MLAIGNDPPRPDYCQHRKKPSYQKDQSKRYCCYHCFRFQLSAVTLTGVRGPAEPSGSQSSTTHLAMGRKSSARITWNHRRIRLSGISMAGNTVFAHVFFDDCHRSHCTLWVCVRKTHLFTFGCHEHWNAQGHYPKIFDPKLREGKQLHISVQRVQMHRKKTRGSKPKLRHQLSRLKAIKTNRPAPPKEIQQQIKTPQFSPRANAKLALSANHRIECTPAPAGNKRGGQ